MLVRALVAVFVFLGFSVPLLAQVATPQAVIEALRVPDLFAIMRDEGIAYGSDLEAELFPGAGGARWAGKVAAIYDPDSMKTRFETSFSGMLGDDAAVLDPLLAFFGSDQGKRILKLELEARRALLDDTVEEAAKGAFADMTARNAPRLDLLRRFADANDLIEQNVAGALNSNLAFYQGLADAGAFAENGPSDADILSDIRAQEPDIRAETEDWLFPYLSLAYGPLSDEDMQAYLAFSATPAAIRLNAAMFGAFDAVFTAISRDLGQAAARMMTGQDI